MKDVLWYNSPAKYWTDALPLGNGTLGAMLFFDISEDRIALNHDRLWTGHPVNITNDKAKKAYGKACSLTAEGRLYDAQKELEKHFSTCWSQAYLPLGDIIIRYEDKGLLKKYKRELKLSRSMATAQYNLHSNDYSLEAFVSFPDNALVYRIKTVKPINFTVSLDCKLQSVTDISENMIITDGLCPSDSDSFSSKYPCHSLVYSKDEAEQGVSFTAALKINTDGVCSSDGEDLSVTGSTLTTLYFTAETNFENPFTPPCQSAKEPHSIVLERIGRLSKEEYNDLKTAHLKDYKELYDRVELDLCGKNKNSDLPTDKRLKKYQDDPTDLELYELFYNFARYLLISCSREGSAAANLQGIWSENLKAPWNSNYTVNINTEMNYWHALPCGLDRMCFPLFDLIHTLSITGEKTAADFYGARGFVCHHNSDLWGFTLPTSGSASWSYFNAASGWLCHHLYEYYEYSLDKAFLANTALPIMKKAAEFYLDILKENGDGTLSVSPSTSPENLSTDGRHSVSLAKSTTITDTVVLNLFNEILSACDELGICDEFYVTVRNAAEKIKPFKVGSYGQLLEWDDEYEECDIHHRHVSHLIGLHPFNLITPEKTPELAEACRATLFRRGDDGTGWSLAWKINFYARLGDGNSALRLLKRQLRPVRSRRKSDFNYGDGGGTYPNLFDAHPPFQIDGNFGAASGINEMLVKSDSECIYLLPALPDEWKNGSVKGMRVKGNMTIDFEWKDGKVASYSLRGGQKKVVFE